LHARAYSFLGTPHDVTLQEIRIECFFPVDEGSAYVFRSATPRRSGEAF